MIGPYPASLIPPPGSSGLTRLQLAMMEQRISAKILSDITHIPGPTLSQYCLGRRHISRSHLPLLAIALAVTPPQWLRGYATEEDCVVIEDEWSDENPFFYWRNFKVRPDYMLPDNPVKPHLVDHTAEVHQYEYRSYGQATPWINK